MAEAQSDREVLTAYWVRLDTLTDAEWRTFYTLVHKALQRCPAPELAALPDDRASYIDEFFTEKLFFKAQRMLPDGIQSISGGSLCRFFRNYLLDEIERYKRTPLTGSDASDDDTAPDRNPDDLAAEILKGIGHDKIEASARNFLTTLPDWAMLMLRGHFCADEDAVAMSELCQGIASYHYKAQKLGVTVKKDAKNLLGYEHTLIGEWMQSLGISILPENHGVMKLLLGIICLEATARLEGGAP